MLDTASPGVVVEFIDGGGGGIISTIVVISLRNIMHALYLVAVANILVLVNFKN